MKNVHYLDDKERRRARRRNRIVKELRSGKYYPRVIPSKNKNTKDWDFGEEDF